MNHKVNDVLLSKMIKTVYFVIFGSIFLNYVLHKYTGNPFAIVAEVCVNGERARSTGWPALTWSLLNLIIFQVQGITKFTIPDNLT